MSSLRRVFDDIIVACLYIQFSRNKERLHDYHRAIYLRERTVQDLKTKISEKQQIDPEYIVRILHVKQNGITVVVDDDVVRELPDGKDICADISDVAGLGDGVTNSGSSPVEIKLIY